MLKELGEYKNSLGSMLVNDDKVCKLLLGENYENDVEDLDSELDKHVFKHLYVPGVIDDVESYILFDTKIIRTNGATKTMQIIVQAICHKDAVKYKEKPKGYSGLRYDVLSQYIEELLCPSDKEKQKEIIKKYAIGGFELQNVDLFLADKFVGRVLYFIAPEFR